MSDDITKLSPEEFEAWKDARWKEAEFMFGPSETWPKITPMSLEERVDHAMSLKTPESDVPF